jgi:branched-chain amino acid transport system substrate-binding protein
LCVASLFVACSKAPSASPAVPSDAPSDEPLRIGVILPLTGTATYYGTQAQRGVELAREELRREYPGLVLDVVYEDSAFTPLGGVAAYRAITASGDVPAVITHASPVAIAVQPLAEQDGVLQMTIIASVDSYSSPDDLSFRTSMRTQPETRLMAEHVAKQRFERLEILHMNNEIGLSVRDSLAAAVADASPDTLVTSDAFVIDATDWRSTLLKLKTADVDAVYLVGTTGHVSLILKQADELGYRPQFLSFRTAEDPALLRAVGPLADGLIYTYSFDPALAPAFDAAYRARYDEPPELNAAEGYEGLRLVVLAFEGCEGNATCAAQRLTGLRDYPSVFGPLTFDNSGDVVYGSFLKQVRDGAFVRYDG